MTSHTAIADTTETVLTVLREGLADREDVPFLDADHVIPASPADLPGSSETRLAVFPYRIEREGKGRPGQVQTGQDTFREPPLILRVFYLVTALPGEADGIPDIQQQQTALGAAMQVLHDSAAPETLVGSLEETPTFKIELHSDATGDIERIWETFVDTPIQPAAIYEAGPVTIESRKEREVTRVAERDVDIDRTND